MATEATDLTQNEQTSATDSGEVTSATTEGQGTEEKAAKPPKAVNSTAQKLVGTRYASFIGPRGTFQPGYDAKAKSQMIKDATQDEDPALAAEARQAISTMNWDKHLDAKLAIMSRPKVEKRESTPRQTRTARAKKVDASQSADGEAEPQVVEETAQFRVQRGKSGYFVMDGEAGLVKFNTQEEAQQRVDWLISGAVTPEQVRAGESPSETPAE